MSIKDLPEQERPRERLARYGSDALSTIELLAILLGSGTENRPVLQVASELLAHFGTVNALADASLTALKEVKGIGHAKAVQLKAAFGLLNRLEEKKQGEALDSPEKVYALIANEMSQQKTESLMIVLRDVRRCRIHHEIISKGTLTELLMHPREIFHEAIRHRAHNLIIAHNHPTGDPAPSKKDIDTTQLLAASGKIVGIELTDHLIIGKQAYFSFHQKGLLNTRY